MSRPLRLTLVVAALVAAVALLFLVVFPWVDRTFVTDPVLGAAVPFGAPLRSRPGRAEHHRG